MPAIFPNVIAKKDRSGRVTTYPDVCKMPGPPAPFTPVPYPAMHGKKLADARKLVSKTKDNLAAKTKAAGISRSMGNEPGVLKGIVTMKNLEKLILNHEGALKKAPRTDYAKALKIQQKFEKDVMAHVRELEKAFRADREMQKVIGQITAVVGKAARGA